MKVQQIQQQYPKFKSNSTEPREKITDKFSSKIKNSADMNDCVSVPRTIFKGYLAFMVGTALNGLAMFIPEKAKKIKTSMLVTGSLINTYGIWAFARPYILKDVVPTVQSAPKEIDS